MDETYAGFDPDLKPVNEDELKEPTDKRMFVLAAALKDGLFLYICLFNLNFCFFKECLLLTFFRLFH